jgi:hypothetical protein
MAVIESLPGIEVTIGVDGEAAKEYDVPLAHHDEDNTRPGMTREYRSSGQSLNPLCCFDEDGAYNNHCEQRA